MESLWVATDEHLKSQLLAQLGPSSAYTTLRLQNAYILAQTHPSEWVNLALPFAVIMSYQSNAVPAGHDGDSTFKRDQSYAYTILTVCDGPAEDATRDAKILAGRVEKLLASLRFAGVVADDGSQAKPPRRGTNGVQFNTQIELWQRSSHSSSDRRYGVAVTAFTVTGVTT